MIPGSVLREIKYASTVRTPSLQHKVATERLIHNNQPSAINFSACFPKLASLARNNPINHQLSTINLSLKIFPERLPIDLASLNKGHLLQRYDFYGHLPWLQEGADKILNRLLCDLLL
jgi:hypothetical protein